MRPRRKIAQFLARFQTPEPLVSEREEMVRGQIELRGVRDRRVLTAMRQVPRHLFVPLDLRDRAYEDGPLAIGFGQTISQPFVVASMTQELKLSPTDKVLEIGTGCGYQTAVLAELVAHVYSVETVEPLAEKSRSLLKKLDYQNISVRCGDGHQGWPEAAPFDAIMVTAAPEEVPAELIHQLKTGGRMLIPVGAEEQSLCRVTKTPDGIKQEHLYPVRFVPMVRR
jgi:protein-L-isoaspartate(D-aspartate) O-methyltransferase